MVLEASGKYRARQHFANDVMEDSWGAAGVDAFDMAVADAVMSHLGKAAQPVREPPLSEVATKRARQMVKHAIVTATEKDNCYSWVCPYLTHMIIMQQELSTASYKKIGPKDGAAAKALMDKIQAQTERLSVVRAYGEQKGAAINRRKKNQAVMEDKDAPLAAADPLNRLATMQGTIKQKAIYPPGTPAYGPPPPGGMRSAVITTALRPITAACDTKPTPLCDFLLAIDKLFVIDLKELTFELFTLLPPAVAAQYSLAERQRLSAMAFPLPVFEGADKFAEFVERFNRRNLRDIPVKQRPRIDLDTWDVVNCYPSTDTAHAIERRKELTKTIKNRRKQRHGKGDGNPPIFIDVGLDEAGEYTAHFTAEKPTDSKSKRRSIITLERALFMFEFLMSTSPFEYYHDVWLQVLGYQQGAPQSAIEVNWFILGWDEYVYIRQLRDNKELQLLELFAGVGRYLDDLINLADPNFASKRYRHIPFKSPYTGKELDGIYRTGATRPFTLQKEQQNHPEGSTRQHKVAYLDYAVYQDPETGLVSLHLFDKRFALKHDCHPVLRLPSIKSFMWTQAVTGTLFGEINRANGRTDRLAFFIPTLALMIYEDLRRGVEWNQISPQLERYWQQNRPFHWDGQDEASTTDFGVFREEILELLDELFEKGSTTLDTRNHRIGWTPPNWTTTVKYPRVRRCQNPNRRRNSAALAFVQTMYCGVF